MIGYNNNNDIKMFSPHNKNIQNHNDSLSVYGWKLNASESARSSTALLAHGAVATVLSSPRVIVVVNDVISIIHISLG